MNVSDLKAFVGDKPVQNRPDADMKQQLREMGLRQAATGVSQTNSSNLALSSNTTVGARVLNFSLSESLKLKGIKTDLPAPEPKQESLFDFEEVAKNVLNFIGGAIKHAAAKGMDEEKLLDMFEQARSGVLKGIKMAEKDLAGMMNEEIETGIEKSRTLIEQGIAKLQESIFGAEPDTEQQVKGLTTTELAYSSENKGELSINTRDGDEVRIRFEDFQAFSLNKSVFNQAEFLQPVPPETESANEGLIEQSEGGASLPSVEDRNAGQDESSESAQVFQYQYFEASSFSFSVQGELDEDEIQAIGKLVTETSELAETFFNGDIDKAFEQALELGFDDKELTSFALQLNRQERVEVVKTYESIANFRQDDESPLDNVAQVKPIADYMDKMFKVLEQASSLLEDGQAYDKLISGIMNKLEDVGTTDLLDAINRFNSFNNRILDNAAEQ